jgi:iron complex outermembrane receptor protein
MTLQIYYDRTNLSMATPALIVNNILLAPAGRFEDELDTYDVDFNHRINLGRRHQIIWGLGYRFTHDIASNSPALGFFPENVDQDLFSAFLQDEVAISNNVKITFGTKVEHNDYTDWEFEPSARFSWNVNPRQMVWGAVSRAVRAPSRIDRDVSQATPPYFVLLVGGPDFSSETVVAYELGYRAIIGDKFVASASTFYNLYDDIRSTSLTPTLIFPLFFENNVEGDIYGIELNGRYQATDWWQLRGGYTYLEADIHVEPGKFDFNEALNETSDPEQQFSIRSSMNLPKRMEIDAGLRWVDILQAHDGPTPGNVPSYTELDLRLSCLLAGQLELSLTGQNLLHDSHPEYGYPNSSRVEIQRNIYGKAAWRF